MLIDLYKQAQPNVCEDVPFVFEILEVMLRGLLVIFAERQIINCFKKFERDSLLNMQLTVQNLKEGFYFITVQIHGTV